MDGLVRKTVKKALDFLSSYGFAAAIFVLLLLLVFLGTLEQVDQGLFQVQKKYFESIFLIHKFFGVVPVPLPGVYLLLVLFTLNILAGMILRMRRGLAQAGILIAHAGMVLLVVGGFVKFKYADDGNLAIWEHDRSNVFESYHDYELAITPAGEAGPVSEYIIPQDKFIYLKSGQSATFKRSELPFDLTVTDYMPNASPMPKGPMFEAPTKVIDGYFLQPLPVEKDAERNVPGMYATITDKKNGQTQEAILVCSTRSPMFPPVELFVTVDGRPWKIDLRKKLWQLPFTIVLDKFTHELHPRTSMAKAFMSDVTKIEGDSSQGIKIAMNEPLRYKGYTLFQSSYGPPDAQPGARMFSVFSVVRNPADQWPLYSCIIVTFGLLVHFSQKLWKYLKAESKRRAT